MPSIREDVLNVIKLSENFLRKWTTKCVQIPAKRYPIVRLYRQILVFLSMILPSTRTPLALRFDCLDCLLIIIIVLERGDESKQGVKITY
jgi:hypothetical protein